MKTKLRITLMAVTLISLASPVLAATEGRVDNSNYLAWGFLGMCALIVICQVFPIVSMILNLIKGSSADENELETATSKYR